MADSPFDLSEPPVTFIQQAIDALPSMVSPARGVPFFGRAVGLVINYAPDKAMRCNLDGNPLEVLPKAYRVGEVQLSLDGKRIEPRVLGSGITAGRRSWRPLTRERAQCATLRLHLSSKLLKGARGTGLQSELGRRICHKLASDCAPLEWRTSSALSGSWLQLRTTWSAPIS